MKQELKDRITTSEEMLEMFSEKPAPPGLPSGMITVLANQITIIKTLGKILEKE